MYLMKIHVKLNAGNAYLRKLMHIICPLGKVLVHEWAHLRWGVFDEYVTQHSNGDRLQPFYMDKEMKVWW